MTVSPRIPRNVIKQNPSSSRASRTRMGQLMIRRGRILRDTAVGPGLLVVDETQYPFTLEGIWKSSAPPVAGKVVDVDIEGGRVVSVTAVPGLLLAREQGAHVLGGVRAHGGAFARRAVARYGASALTAGAILVTGWFFLVAASLATPVGRVNLTFWQALGAINSGDGALLQRVSDAGGSVGIYGLLAVAALSAPFVAPLWRDRRAHLAGVLPLVLMLVVAWKITHLANAPSGDASVLGAAEADVTRSLARDLRDQMRRSISIGLGTYASGAAAAYFAFVSIRRYLEDDSESA